MQVKVALHSLVLYDAWKLEWVQSYVVTWDNLRYVWVRVGTTCRSVCSICVRALWVFRPFLLAHQRAA